MKNLFKYISLKDLQREDSPIVHFITEEMVQEFSEDNYGKRLNEEEVANLLAGFHEDGQSYIYYLMDSAVRSVLGEEQTSELWMKCHKPEKSDDTMKRVPDDCPSDFPLLYVIRDVVQTYAMVAFGRRLTREEMEGVETNIALEASQKLHEHIERQVRVTDLEAAKK